MEAAKVSISRWVDKTTMGHLHNGTLLSRKEETFTLCNSVCGPEEHYAKWIDGEQMTASGQVGLGVEGLSKKEKGLMDMDNNVVIAGGRVV